MRGRQLAPVIRATVILILSLVVCGCARQTSSSPLVGTPGVPNIVQPGPSPEKWIELPVQSIDSFARVVRGYRDSLWIVDHTRIIQLSYSGQAQTYAIPSGLNGYQITEGPRGLMWFCEYGGSGESIIASISPRTGSIREYPIPGPLGPNEGETIGAGADGKLWFGAGPGHIGSMTPDGTFAFYPTPNTDLVQSLIAGPDGNVWTVNDNSPSESSAYRIAPDGSMTAYQLPVSPQTGGTCPIQIISGPEGSMYYTDPCSQWVALLSTSGTVAATYPSPHSPFFLTSDDISRVFFTALPPVHTGHERGYLGVLDTLNGTTSYRIAPQEGMRMASMAFGADGNIWMMPASSPWEVVVFVRLVMDVSPSTISFSGAGQSQQIVVSEKHYSGTWSATSEDASVATVQPGGTSGIFVVTGTGAGSTSIDIADKRHNDFLVQVSVGP